MGLRDCNIVQEEAKRLVVHVGGNAGGHFSIRKRKFLNVV